MNLVVVPFLGSTHRVEPEFPLNLRNLQRRLDFPSRHGEVLAASFVVGGVMRELKEAADSLERALKSLIEVTVAQALQTSAPVPVAPLPAVGVAVAVMLTVAQAAEQTGFHEATLRAWIRGGRLVASKPGRHYRIKADDLQGFLASGGASESKPEADDVASRILKRVGRGG